MKEQTYGWYPSAKDVYVDRRMGVPNTYRKYIYIWLPVKFINIVNFVTSVVAIRLNSAFPILLYPDYIN